jgi:hypothetical protein
MGKKSQPPSLEIYAKSFILQLLSIFRKNVRPSQAKAISKLVRAFGGSGAMM